MAVAVAMWTGPQLAVYADFMAFMLREFHLAQSVPAAEAWTEEQVYTHLLLGLRLDHRNYVGLGFGSKFREGSWTDEASLCAYVIRKVKADDVEPFWIFDRLAKDAVGRFLQQFPTRENLRWLSDGISTDVIQVGVPEAFAVAMPATRMGREYTERVPGGCSVGVSLSATAGYAAPEGTLGAWVWDDQKKTYLLGCWHCVDPDNGAAGPPARGIEQPRNRQVIGSVGTTIDPRKNAQLIHPGMSLNQMATVDAALGTLGANIHPGDFLLGVGEITDRRSIRATFDPVAVLKSGAKTGVTRGITRQPLTNIRLKLPDGSHHLYLNQMAISSSSADAIQFSQQGDSGAIVIDKDSQAMGMIVGGDDISTIGHSPPMSYATPIEDVLLQLQTALGVKSLTFRTY